jgi:hypothetical protein
MRHEVIKTAKKGKYMNTLEKYYIFCSHQQNINLHITVTPYLILCITITKTTTSPSPLLQLVRLYKPHWSSPAFSTLRTPARQSTTNHQKVTELYHYSYSSKPHHLYIT